RLFGSRTVKSNSEAERHEKRRMMTELLTSVWVKSQCLCPQITINDLCPESYRVNSPDEIRLLAIVENFQLQYSHLCPERKPLLLCPVNECGVKKFVSMTLRPAPTASTELFTWEGCASFVADFLSLDLLESPVDVPRYLFSSTSVLQAQRATCFEFATLLCSLLLGAHYDAYCVSGYAVKEMCLLDQSLQECPLLDTEVKVGENKYTVKPLKELKSNFVTQQQKKKQDAALPQKQKLNQVKFKRPADLLRGLRVHCWVLVLSGSRSIRENFFIDPLTGNSYRTDDDNFLGIESVWNNLNYYVNMQDCSSGCADMVYDLEDLKMWEPVLFSATSKKQLILEVAKKRGSKLMSRISCDEENIDQCQSPIRQSPYQTQTCRLLLASPSASDLENCWPGGQKVIRYRKAKLEKFGPYLKPDGLVTRLTTYKDLDCTEVFTVKEWYQHRNDHLERREVNKIDNSTTERFSRGRLMVYLCRSVHRYTDTQRETEFSCARVDNLVRRVESPGEMTELFEGRDDFLYIRHVTFDRRVEFSEPDMDAGPDERPLQVKILVERFHRNKSKPANEDVAERVFLLAERRIEVTYHLEDHRFIPSKRSFIKPRESTEKKKAEDFTPDMVSGFQVDPSEKPPNTLILYGLLVNLMKDEDTVVHQIRGSQKEVTTSSVSPVPLHRSDIYGTRACERTEDQRWLQEKEKDILAPLLIRLGNAETLSAEDAKQLHQDCLAEFKQRLVEHANLIQERYEKETQELQEKQQWYQKNQLNMTKQQEEEYQNFCSEKTLQIHVAKKRLRMHKETAPQKYRVLDQKLKRDPRLSPHLLG
uniref:Dynein regulatory complex subunit 7 n=1 Tax=Sparus aurata TaxID=8175 RepID=A0A671YPR0_SPAAU